MPSRCSYVLVLEFAVCTFAFFLFLNSKYGFSWPEVKFFYICFCWLCVMCHVFCKVHTIVCNITIFVVKLICEFFLIPNIYFSCSSGTFEVYCSKDIKIQGVIGPCTSLEKVWLCTLLLCYRFTFLKDFIFPWMLQKFSLKVITAVCRLESTMWPHLTLIFLILAERSCSCWYSHWTGQYSGMEVV